MSTLVKIVKRADLGHGLIAVTLRPNDDATHDSVRTYYVTVGTTTAASSARTHPLPNYT